MCNEFKIIPDYPNYMVNGKGDIFSIKRNKKLTPYKRKNKYLIVGLYKNKKMKLCFVHRIVLTTFKGNQNKDVNHINGIKSDNRLENLEWCTRSENMKHAFNIGLISHKGEKHNRAKLKEKDILFIREELKNKTSAPIVLSKKFNIGLRQIYSIKNYETWHEVK